MIGIISIWNWLVYAGLFVTGFPKLVRFQAHHDKILQVLLPKLKKHLDRNNIDCGLYTLKWFFQCFLDRVPFELALRLWDIFLLDGDKVLYCGAYTILKLHYKPLLARKNMDDILFYMQMDIPNKVGVDCDKAIEVYQRCQDDLRRKKLENSGEPSENESPKKPFGVIENIPQPVPVRREKPEEQINREIEAKRQQRAQLATDETDDFDNEEEEMEETSMMEKASASRISLAATSVASSSIADSPRNVQRPLSSISNISYASAVQESPGTLERNTPLKMNGVNHVKSKTSVDNPTSNKLSPTSESFDESAEMGRTLSAKESFLQSVNVNSTHYSPISSQSNSMKKATLPPAMDQHNNKSNERLQSSVITNDVETEGRGNSFTANISDKRQTTGSLGRKPVKPIRASMSPSPPPPPPRSQQSTLNSTTSTFISHEQTVTSNASYTSSVFEYSSMEIRDSRGLQSRSQDSNTGSIGRKKEPPPVSPRRSAAAASTSPQSSSGRSYTSLDSSVSSVNIPGGEAVRIHVPYVNQAASPTPAFYATTTSNVTNNSTSLTSRNGLDISKNDPNRIKIEVSSSAVIP